MSDIKPFGLEYHDASRFTADVTVARDALDMAVMRSEVADLLYALDHALHALFVSGDEPDWTSPVQREAIVRVRAMMPTLLDRLGLPS